MPLSLKKPAYGPVPLLFSVNKLVSCKILFDYGIILIQPQVQDKALCTQKNLSPNFFTQCSDLNYFLLIVYIQDIDC
ncbi:hypothetical protein BpHYR1_036946 [Brachionus plicatilis]|uniref:Uncharacterized protein n=1 Tax=Brachionus plicatilis TaxID=10195 RepID=A0A3M7S9K5_BRAPC|nr:hypothetical protein BpHYR1_036946 [Brachionus plicatilis]